MTLLKVLLLVIVVFSAQQEITWPTKCRSFSHSIPAHS